MSEQPVRHRTHHRNDDEDSPQSIDDARNRGEQFDREPQQILETARYGIPRAHFGKFQRLQHRLEARGQKTFAQEDRDREAEYGPDHETQHRTVKRADYRWQDAELRLVRVPRAASEKVKPI